MHELYISSPPYYPYQVGKYFLHKFSFHWPMRGLVLIKEIYTESPDILFPAKISKKQNYVHRWIYKLRLYHQALHFLLLGVLYSEDKQKVWRGKQPRVSTLLQSGGKMQAVFNGQVSRWFENLRSRFKWTVMRTELAAASCLTHHPIWCSPSSSMHSLLTPSSLLLTSTILLGIRIPQCPCLTCIYCRNRLFFL